MGLDDIIRKVADALTDDGKKQPGDQDPDGGLLGTITDLLTGQDQDPQANPRVRPASEDPLGDPADQLQGETVGYGRNVRPASEDPLGDPADQLDGRTVLPASQDPLGDPADQVYGRNVRPASEDPLGDPADEETR